MVAFEFVAGTILMAISALGFWIALPKGGQVRTFLRNDEVQSYYTVAVICAFAYGAVNVLVAVRAMFA